MTHSLRASQLGVIAALALCAAGAALADEPASASGGDADGGNELRLRWDARSANPRGPLAAAASLAPGIAAAPPGATVAELELGDTWRTRLPRGPALSLAADAQFEHTRPEGGAAENEARFNELHLSADLGAWQASAGKKIVGWDVGYGFRPNDVVQQEERRTLLAETPEGRPLLQLEHFGAESAASLVWVNPQRLHDGDDEQRFGREGALAVRGYRRAGAADWHLFARHGQHTGASLGAALAWVAGDELELHASVRALQRHDGWRLDGVPEGVPDGTPVTGNPWRAATRGGTSQALLGLSWTGQHQQSLILEAWRDGTALPDAQWDRWLARNTALQAAAAGAPTGLAMALAGNLAWQATPFNTPSLRRDNLFARLAWQPEHWLLWADLLYMPADDGRVASVGLQWQGDRLRLTAAWRGYGGAADSVAAQLPLRRAGLLAAQWSW
jgi:hypothetical protein